jgi:ribosomal-protein-serine acetyltransferase
VSLRFNSVRWPVSESSFLRPLEKTDADELHKLIESNRASLSEWLPWAATQTFEDTAGFIDRAQEQLDDNKGFQVAIVAAGVIAGVIGYVRVDWSNRSTNLGYWLGEEHRGKGTMTAAVWVLTGHAFSDWDLNRVEICAAEENRRSRAIPERLGFRQEGIRREAELVGGRYRDSVVYATLASEWQDRLSARAK